MSHRDKIIPVEQVAVDSSKTVDDSVVVESPLEIRLVVGPESKRRSKSLSITMRTPGDDFDLACGFLVSEGIVNSPDQIRLVEYCGRVATGEATSNLVSVELSPETDFDLQRLQRHFYTTSSCGVCGKASLEALEQQQFQLISVDCSIDKQTIFTMPLALRNQQVLFSKTGGIHAAGLFDLAGKVVSVCEDVGRHNAVDKLIGKALRQGALPLHQYVLVVSGRASFELLQKTLSAGVPIFVAVGAPSSLAVELASQFGITLVGFADSGRFNIYANAERIEF